MRTAPTARTAVRAAPAPARSRCSLATGITRDRRRNTIARRHAVARRRDAARRRHGRRSCAAVTVRCPGGRDLLAFTTNNPFAGRCGRGVIRIHETMFFGVVRNRRILAGGNDPCASTVFQNCSGNSNRRSGGRKSVAKGILGSGLQRVPFFSR